MKKTLILALLLIGFLVTTSCAGFRQGQPNPIQGSYQIETQPVDMSKYTYGETVYVPIYSSVFYDNSSHT